MYILPRYYLNLSMLLKGIYGQVAYTFGAFIINESNTHSLTHVRLAELNSMLHGYVCFNACYNMPEYFILGHTEGVKENKEDK